MLLMRRGFELCRIRQAVLLTSLLACALATAAPQGHLIIKRSSSPGWHGTKSNQSNWGWQTTKLDEARKFFDTLPPANLFVADHGKVVARAIPGHRHLAYGRV
jgi:hypothetical protein